MPICNLCGNDYKNSFEIKIYDQTYQFDCFECAIHQLAPTCHNCDCKIIGHGIEVEPYFYCCAHCARQVEIYSTKDHV